jgi:SPP1 gp7 family putative phage head morphogenesis protein
LYEVQRGINVGWNVASVDENLLSKVIGKPWTADGKNFSERIWGSKSQLISSLHTNITQMCMLGQSPDKAIRNIEKSFGSSRYQASRLVMTESAYFGSIARKDALKELDVEEFEVVATLDSHTSDMCQDMDGQHFPMSDFVVGVTAPPFHPNCRTTTCPYFADDEGMRVARDDNGNRVYVPSNMTYKEWKGEFVGVVDNTPVVKKFVPDQKLVDANKFNFSYTEGEHSIEDDLVKVNPKYHEGRLYQNNCGYCSATYELRRRGYDVEATGKDGLYVSEWSKLFDGFTMNGVTAKRKAGVVPELTENILKWGEGARGSVFVVWDGRQWGHYFNFEVSNGKVLFVDGQNGSSDVVEYFSRSKPSSIKYGRTDNLEMSDRLKNACKNRGD